MEALAFWILAAGLIGFALAVILNRNPVACALCLAASFLFLAGLYISLEAFFLGMVQIIVYAGAVMVLFLFVIMLLDIQGEKKMPLPMFQLAAAFVVTVLFASFFWRVLQSMPFGNAVLEWGETSFSGSAKTVGHTLFTLYTLPFLATAVLILLATIGVVILSKKDLK